MQATAATMPVESAGGAHLKAVPCKLDGRTRISRKIGELRGHFLDALGGPRAVTPITLERIEAAATLKAIAELARQRYIAGVGELNDVVRSANLAARAERALGIREKASAKPAGSELADYLAEQRAKTPAQGVAA